MQRSNKSSGGLVYSTDAGRMCPGCRRPVADCRCARVPVAPAASAGVRASRESKGRGGKVVTVVRGLGLDAGALAALGKQLRTDCGTGGTAKDGIVELQGDHCERVIAALSRQGFMARRAGG